MVTMDLHKPKMGVCTGKPPAAAGAAASTPGFRRKIKNETQLARPLRTTETHLTWSLI